MKLLEKKHSAYGATLDESESHSLAAELDCRARLHADGLNTVKYVQLDVTNLATIEAAKETIDQAEGKLDVLVNNAGTFLAYRSY